MNPLPLAVGCTQPVTVTSFPSLTVTFDFVDCSIVCAASPAEHAATRSAEAMSFIAVLLPVLMPRSYPPCSTGEPPRFAGITIVLRSADTLYGGFPPMHTFRQILIAPLVAGLLCSTSALAQ